MTKEMYPENSELILDACCGSKMFWFDKNHPLCIYNDIRKESHILCDNRSLEISPDTQYDFRELGFEDSKFKLVVFDPPHFNKLGDTSFTALKYGKLFNTWEDDLRLGFSECFRVLQDFGVLVFKWNSYQIPLKEVLALTDEVPLFGHISGKASKTHWLCFMKTKNALCKMHGKVKK